MVPDVPVSGFSSQGPCREVQHSPHYYKSDHLHMDSFPVLPARKPAPLDSSRDSESSDCTEIFCQTPSSLLLQSEVFSTHKSHTTFKAMIVMAPHGGVTFVSGLYMQAL